MEARVAKVLDVANRRSGRLWHAIAPAGVSLPGHRCAPFRLQMPLDLTVGHGFQLARVVPRRGILGNLYEYLVAWRLGTPTWAAIGTLGNL